MYNTLVLCTFITLIIFFTVLELYKYKFYLKGKVIGFRHPNIELENLIVSHLKIQLENGQTVEAEAERCTMCMGQFSIGDDVRLIKSKDRYMIHLPITWRKKKSCN